MAAVYLQAICITDHMHFPSSKILFVVNPISGGGVAAGIDEPISQWGERNGVDVIFPTTTAQCSSNTISQLALQNSATHIVACGGDGTVNMSSNAAVQLQLPFGIISLGSGNGLARMAGIHLPLSESLDVIAHGIATPIDTFTVNGRFACMLSGLGFDAAVSERFAKSRRRGMMMYAKETIAHLFGAKPYRFVIHAGNAHMSVSAFVISVANSNQYGNNFRIAPAASISDGLLDVVIVKQMSKFNLPFALLGHMLSVNNQTTNPQQALAHRHITYLHTPKIVIENPQLAPLHIDGDVAETAPIIEIEVKPASLKLLLPTGS